MRLVPAPVRRVLHGLRYSLGNPVYDVVLLGVLFQGGHMFEHVAQMFQHLVLRRPVSQSHGILASADIEPIHFWANLTVFLVVVVAYYGWEFHRRESALRQFRDMTAIVFGLLLLQGYHVLEHAAKYYQHVRTGLQGTPGLIGMLLKTKTIYFHFAVNLVVTLSLALLLVLYVWHMQLYPAYLQARAARRMKEYLKVAGADGRLTEDERAMLARMRSDVQLFSRELLDKLQRGADSAALKARLREMEVALVASATAQAMVDGRITAEERRLIEEIAARNPIADVVAKLEELGARDHVPDAPVAARPRPRAR